MFLPVGKPGLANAVRRQGRQRDRVTPLRIGLLEFGNDKLKDAVEQALCSLRDRRVNRLFRGDG